MDNISSVDDSLPTEIMLMIFQLVPRELIRSLNGYWKYQADQMEISSPTPIRCPINMVPSFTKCISDPNEFPRTILIHYFGCTIYQRLNELEFRMLDRTEDLSCRCGTGDECVGMFARYIADHTDDGSCIPDRRYYEKIINRHYITDIDFRRRLAEKTIARDRVYLLSFNPEALRMYDNHMVD